MHYYPLYACMHLLPCLPFYPFYFSPNPLFVYYPLHPCMYACIHACMHVCMYAGIVVVHVYMYAWISPHSIFIVYHHHPCMYACTLFIHPIPSTSYAPPPILYTYTYTHTHTHTYTHILLLTNFHCSTLLYSTCTCTHTPNPPLNCISLSYDHPCTSIVHQFDLVFQFLFSLVCPCVLLILSLHPLCPCVHAR